MIKRDNMNKQVVRFDFWINPVFDQHLKGVADIDLTVCRYSDDEKKTLEVFKNTHGRKLLTDNLLPLPGYD